MGRAAKRKQARNKFKTGGKTTPDSKVLESKLNSAKLKDWLVNEWHYLGNFDIFITPKKQKELAEMMLLRLHKELASNYDLDLRVEYNANSHLLIAVGVNVYTWTVWGSVRDSQTGFEYATPDNEEYKI